MIKGYNGFLLNQLKRELFSLDENCLYASSELMVKLKKMSKMDGRVGEMATAIVDTIESEDWLDDNDTKQNFFDITDKDDTVSFLPSNKVPKDWDMDDDPALPYNISGRNEIKIGRIIRALLKIAEISDRTGEDEGTPIKDKDYENFVNAFKSLKVDTKREFKLVNGEDIHKYYQMKNYYSNNGSLGGSCMADESKSTFRVYTENKRKVQLLILIDSDGKIHGRALVWKLKESPCEAKYFMDRVYTNADSDVIKFKNFAEEKGFLYKLKNNSYIEDNVNFMYKGKSLMGEVKVKLDGEFKEYPFIDTMCFLSKKMGDLSNVPSKDCYFLHSVSGECEVCSNCDGDVILKYAEEFCNECALGLEKLEEAGIKTKTVKKLKD
jgi:hypothetical protein